MHFGGHLRYASGNSQLLAFFGAAEKFDSQNMQGHLIEVKILRCIHLREQNYIYVVFWKTNFPGDEKEEKFHHSGYIRK